MDQDRVGRCQYFQQNAFENCLLGIFHILHYKMINDIQNFTNLKNDVIDVEEIEERNHFDLKDLFCHIIAIGQPEIETSAHIACTPVQFTPDFKKQRLVKLTAIRLECFDFCKS